jgi:hypothetical protein
MDCTLCETPIEASAVSIAGCVYHPDCADILQHAIDSNGRILRGRCGETVAGLPYCGRVASIEFQPIRSDLIVVTTDVACEDCAPARARALRSLIGGPRVAA